MSCFEIQHRCARGRAHSAVPLASSADRGVGSSSERTMPALQEKYDEAMFAFSQGDYDSAIGRLREVLGEDPTHFDAQLALGMALYRKGDYAAAIVEGKKAEALKPHEQLVHTNLSLFYMKAGDRATAEHHGLQARVASWREGTAKSKEGEVPPASDPELQMAKPKLEPVKIPSKFPEMPWKKKPPSS